MNGETYSSSRHGSSRDHYSSRADRGERDDRRDRDRTTRRRSRSPHGHRSSRRDYDGDTYSSSRDYREREREDRYAGRDRREDRSGWERGDRGPRRDRRADDGEPRRDRDLFDDRGGRGRRDRGDRGGDRERKRSKSPPAKKREPTPDLTGTVGVLQRKRRLTQWDIKPPGYENVTAEQAKLSGMFPLPGAPRQQPMDPSRLQAFMNPSTSAAVTSSLKPSKARQAKRLFAYNIPATTTDESLVEFFNLQLNGLNVISGENPCLVAQITSDRAYALLEFKTPEDATMALALDGISMEAKTASNGASNGDTAGLSIRRPKDYIVAPALDDAEEPEGVLAAVVRDSANKICISHVPTYLNDEQVTELLQSFGELKKFVLVKDIGSEESRGIAFCEYTDPSSTDIAVEGLNGMELGEEHLKVQRASIGQQQASGLEMGVNAMTMLAGTTTEELEQGRVLQLLNMVTPEELMDNDEYEEICEDVKEECAKYGPVNDLKIPRPSGGRQSAGVGKIFVKFEQPESAQRAFKALAGRKFADRTVVVSFFSEEYFDVNAW
ncbi:hypothetical protein P152DRAFT_457032 [Eremomyces bilateralis CBS 781.70]|uniref:Splicing factor U2AF subunit n=1 Tax=Eremomyces bilateralis CBS 781.70 TaxID=1392243 RepID=A0A6G1G6H6_9PEZI|nr:uncharacterized protein P152DRAFT_457032 [Eremomyces bilateralis CBS 781.70]KAF1813653.1 hypothetical protein P152DRAFT_457032 [Eremomyces bilateralis CBS 781.70]